MKKLLVTATFLFASAMRTAAGASAETPTTKPALNPQIAALGDGQAVQLKTNQPTPLGRGYCARMPYDPVNKVGLVYGACHNPKTIAQNDVWQFDAATATWTELVPTDPRTMDNRYNEIGVQVPKTGPERPSGVGHTYSVICFDTALGKMVSLRGGTPPWLMGWPKPAEVETMQAAAKAAGVDLAKARRGLPWLFDVKTRTWKLAAPEAGETPGHTRAEACVYDPKHKLVLYWSTDGDVANKKGGVYAYDGAKNRWTFSATKGGPAPGIEQLACWDTVNERVLYFTGSYSKDFMAKAFDYPTLTWTNLAAKNWPRATTTQPTTAPAVGFCSGGSTLSFDSLNGVALAFRQDQGIVVVHPYNVRTNAFEPAQKTPFAMKAGQLNSYYDPDQNAVILVGGGDLGRTQTWAYRYKKGP